MVFAILFLTGLISGFVDSIAGGGGLIQLPILLSLGIPPKQALGTNKLGSSFGAFSASYRYAKSNMVSPRSIIGGIVITFLGACIGTSLVQRLNSDFLVKVIPFLLLAIFIYTLLSPSLGTKDLEQKIKTKSFYLIFGVLIGFYDGFFGPGTGSFWTMAFVYFLGFNLVKATAHTKVLNFTSNVSALLFFSFGGNVLFLKGIVLGLGSFVGSQIGAKLVVKKGASFVRPLFLTVVGLTILKLLLK